MPLALTTDDLARLEAASRLLVSPLQMTRGYAMIANGGKLVEPHLVNSVEEPRNEGEPPVMNASYDDPKVREQYPFADELRETLEDSVTRPATPSYSDVTLAIQDALHPPRSINPQADITELTGFLNTLADGGLY